MGKKWVYSFGGGAADGDASMRNLLGGKGANLAEMSNLGLPVPPGFTITTEVCTVFYEKSRGYPEGLEEQVVEALARTGEKAGARFGDSNPLLVSVRSGARVSMPGMMDTVLNLGLNDTTVDALAARTQDMRFARDSYRRFIQMYADVVLGVPHDHFEGIIDLCKKEKGYVLDTELEAQDWEEVIEQYKAVVLEKTGSAFPQEPIKQLWGAVGAVFGSWQIPRAKTYRRIHHIPEDWGTAVNIQAMVFGNMGETSATGVAFTRDPSTGAQSFYGEFLVNAQGEDVVAGIRTPRALTVQGRETAGGDVSLEEAMPELFAQLLKIREILEKHYRDMQDIEFTIQEGTLWMLQTRSGKRTAQAALKIAVDMVSEGLISQEEAVLRVDAESLNQLLHPTLDPDAPREVIAAGLPASPGAASGEVVFSSTEAEEAKQKGHAAILVRVETSPEDIHGMHAAEGILTTRGGMTSHAAVVARGMGKPCITGTGAIRIDYEEGYFVAGDARVKRGEVITIDGGSGEVMRGDVPRRKIDLSGDFELLMKWSDGLRRMKIRANAETPLDARAAREFGAEGIGLCRTEHMFFDPERISAMREMILARDEHGRRKALEKILPMQRNDFVELFEIMAGLPVTIRLLDPPLHEFLPRTEEIPHVAETLGVDSQQLKQRMRELAEFNPMLGHRGCRLGVSYPEIYEIQARAIFEAVPLAQAKTGFFVIPEIMIPFIATAAEFEHLKRVVDAVAQEVDVQYQVGTMIELPRAALCAGEIAPFADFFSFGTNDLTQTTFGISRDDIDHFLSDYISEGILARDPFATLDKAGVGVLVLLGTQKGRAAHPGLKVGVCGEHGGDPESIFFCEEAGLDYVSCSPYRVPIARLAAAQAALKAVLKKKK